MLDLKSPDVIRQLQFYLAAKLRSAREAADLSLEDAAAFTMIDSARLHAMEEAETAPLGIELFMLTRSYGCSIDALFDMPEDGVMPSVAGDELLENFLQVDQPGRGQLFADFLTQIEAKQD